MHKTSICALILLTTIVLLMLSETASAQNRIPNRSRPSLSCVVNQSEQRYICTDTRVNNPLHSYFERADIERAERLARRARPIAGSASCSGEGDFKINFSGQFRKELYYNGEFLERFGPGTCYMGEYPEGVSGDKTYKSYSLVPNKEGGTSVILSVIIPENTGLTFTDPEAGKGKK